MGTLDKDMAGTPREVLNADELAEQLADYAAWAVLRKLERGDSHWFNLIDHKGSSVFEPFSGSPDHY